MQAISRPLTRTAPKTLRRAAALSTWSAVPAGPPDPILGVYRSSRCLWGRRQGGSQEPPRPFKWLHRSRPGRGSRLHLA